MKDQKQYLDEMNKTVSDISKMLTGLNAQINKQLAVYPKEKQEKIRKLMASVGKGADMDTMIMKVKDILEAEDGEKK